MTALYVIANGDSSFLSEFAKASGYVDEIKSLEFDLQLVFCATDVEDIVARDKDADVRKLAGDAGVELFFGPMEKLVLEEGYSELLESDTGIIFIDYTAAKRKDSFDQTYLGIMERLNSVRFENRYYISPTATVTNETVGKLLRDFIAGKVTHYNPFSGKEMAGLTKIETDAVLGLMRDYCFALAEYLEAGFHNMEILSIPSGWVMNLHSRANSLLVNYFGLLPVAPDKVKHRNLEFGENAQYRQVVTDGMVAVVSSFIVANKLADKKKFSRFHYSGKLYERFASEIEKMLA